MYFPLNAIFEFSMQFCFKSYYFISYWYSTPDSIEKNLFTVKHIVFSEESDFWSFHSLSKDLVQVDIDRMKGLHVSFKWKDQGWGNHKGRVAVKVMNGTDEVFQIDDWSVAPHEKQTVSVMYAEDHYFVNNLVAGCRFELWYIVGGGGLHSLEVEDFSVDILSAEGNKCDNVYSRYPNLVFTSMWLDVQKAKELKNEQFIKGSAEGEFSSCIFIYIFTSWWHK